MKSDNVFYLQDLLHHAFVEFQTFLHIFAGDDERSLHFHESMMQYDVASTIAHIFGLQQPQVWIGRPVTQVFK